MATASRPASRIASRLGYCVTPACAASETATAWSGSHTPTRRTSLRAATSARNAPTCGCAAPAIPSLITGETPAGQPSQRLVQPAERLVLHRRIEDVRDVEHLSHEALRVA